MEAKEEVKDDEDYEDDFDLEADEDFEIVDKGVFGLLRSMLTLLFRWRRRSLGL